MPHVRIGLPPTRAGMRAVNQRLCGLPRPPLVCLTRNVPALSESSIASTDVTPAAFSPRAWCTPVRHTLGTASAHARARTRTSASAALSPSKSPAMYLSMPAGMTDSARRAHAVSAAQRVARAY